MAKKYTGREYEEILGMDLTESDIINAKIQDAYGLIRAGKRSRGTIRTKGAAFKGLAMGMSAVAAALALSVTVCVANPALAARLPVIGNIFSAVGKDSGYKGDFGQGAVQLITPDHVQEDGTADSEYAQTDNGITFTISECNYESMAMYMAASIRSEEGFSEDMRNFARYGSYEETKEDDMAVPYSVLYMESTSEADFSASGKGVYEGDPGMGTSSPYHIEGKFVDEHTFVGIIRVDLMHMGILDEAEGWSALDNADIPDEFAYALHVTDLFADPEGEHLSGHWDFAFGVRLNHENTVRKELNDTNEEGVGIGTVIKTAYEVHASLLLPEGKSSTDYVVAICDAEGKPLESQGEYAEIYSVYGRDVSRLYIYVVDYITYMDECKGNNYHNLPDKAVYQAEVAL